MPSGVYFRTEEHKHNISLANKGKVISVEQRKKLSLALIGRTSWNKGLARSGFSGHHVTEELKLRLRQANLGKSMSAEAKAKISQFQKGSKHSPVTCEKRRVAMLAKWKEIKYAQGVWDAIHRQPNWLELRLLELLNKLYPNEWAYVGNGKLIIDGKCPDFVNVNGKKQLIELYGDHWHKGHNPQDRIDFFKNFGYKTLVIYGHELRKDMPKVLSKLKAFSQMGGTSLG